MTQPKKPALEKTYKGSLVKQKLLIITSDVLSPEHITKAWDNLGYDITVAYITEPNSFGAPKRVIDAYTQQHKHVRQIADYQSFLDIMESVRPNAVFMDGAIDTALEGNIFPISSHMHTRYNGTPFVAVGGASTVDRDMRTGGLVRDVNSTANNKAAAVGFAHRHFQGLLGKVKGQSVAG